jgi:deoxyribodipyrimidine photolyase-related protein
VSSLRFILGDQLSRRISSLSDVQAGQEVVLLAEVAEEATYVAHHLQKLVFVFSAMRHFADELRAAGHKVDYVQLDEPGNTGSLTGELRRAVARHQVASVVVTSPGEWRVRQMAESWAGELGIQVEIREDDRFLCPLEEFASWASDRKELRMEFFYRQMRRKTGWLVEDGKPVGGKWNYDKQNRQPLGERVNLPERKGWAVDETTKQVGAMVRRRFANHFGELGGVAWAVTREQAREALDTFIEVCLAEFGDYQDAMKLEQDFLFHSAISPYLNIGLLLPGEVCEAAVAAYHAGDAPVNAVEGFLRQVLGWREFVRGIYWRFMPEYRAGNFFAANRHLPDFYWTAETDMRCLREVVLATRRNAYAHHIQRRMVTGNFALLAGVAPAEVEEWYLLVYADAYEWVELPNTHGMALHADGGLLGSKPYAASGSYINRMSDYCKDCGYSPTVKLGQGACPFNYLYWNFIIVNEDRLQGNPRMAMIYRTLKRMPEDKRRENVRQAETFLSEVCA